MKKGLKITGFLLVFFFGCSENERLLFPLEASLTGYTYPGTKTRTVDYTPEGLFLLIQPSRVDFWNNVTLIGKNGEIEGKVFFYENRQKGILFDKLEAGPYMLRFHSDFNDVVERSIRIGQNSSLDFPESLKAYYKKTHYFEPVVQELKAGDTLRMLFQSETCAFFKRKLFEFHYEDDKLVGRMSSDGQQWRALQVKDMEDRLNQLLEEGKQFKGFPGDSSADHYTFEWNDELFTFSDDLLQWHGIERLLR